MSFNTNYWFRQGRNNPVTGRVNPGILTVDEKYEFVAHEATKDKKYWSYVCKYRRTPKVMCLAKARVSYWEEKEKWILQHADSHVCEPNRPRVIAELLRDRMKSLVRQDPAKAVGKAVRAIRIEAAREYSEDEVFYQKLVAELGTDSALERQLLRVRAEVIGPTPRSRNEFQPKNFISRIFGDTNDVVLDSNDLSEGWKDDIDRTNRSSEYEWNNLTTEILNMVETEHEEYNSEAQDIDTEDSVDKDLPKRVVAFTSPTLLKQLSKNLKTSVDGTFKSSCSLWTQQFIWMVKSQTGYWIPVVWGWLPDKTETSYRVFFLLVEKKMNELGLQLNVESVLADFELNILKAVDEMLQSPILGCFFHYKTCIQRRVDRNGFKTRYQNDEKFNNFINELSALSHLPIDDIEEGLEDVNKRFEFDDEEAKTFKIDMIRYMNDFWIHGCIPPRVWNTFGRSDSLTNNNQEGYNSKFNKELKETHPSPGVLLCHVKDQIILAEEKIVRVTAAVPKPAQRRVYKNLAKTRLRLKKNYLLDRENGEQDAIAKFLRSMGHNVVDATMSGRTDEYQESRSKRAWETSGDKRVSSWVPRNEDSVLEELSCEDNFENRKIGVKNKEPWKKKKCATCHLGFNSKSAPIKCHGCDSYTHRKPSCFNEGSSKKHFNCKVCTPAEQRQSQLEKAQAKTTHCAKVDGGFKCEKCELVVKTMHNLKRHIERKHIEEEEQAIIIDESSNIIDHREKDVKVDNNISDFLKSIGLEKYTNIFKDTDIDINVLLDLRTDEFMEMSRELGISSWAHRHKIKRAIEERKSKPVLVLRDHDDDDHIIEETQISEAESVENSLQVSCELCAAATQHKCRLCQKQACNLFCSIQDPNSDNESHRVHKHGDERCITVTNFECQKCQNSYNSAEDLNLHIEVAHAEHSNGNLVNSFECPTCNEMFNSAKSLEKHVDLMHGQISSLSLISNASSDSWMHVSCDSCARKFQNDTDKRRHDIEEHGFKECQFCGALYCTAKELERHLQSQHEQLETSCDICKMKFKNEEDMEYHRSRVHEYGETCCMYPCEKCGYQGQDLESLEEHIKESHVLSDLEELGIVKLPVYSRRIKQTFPGLVIDEEGSIDIEESDDEYTIEEIHIEDQPQKKNRPKRKVITESLLIPNKRTRPEKVKQANKSSASQKTSFMCDICQASLSRKDSLTRHMKKMHNK